MKRKLLSLCMVLALCLTMLPTTALAVDTYDLWVNGIQVTSENAADVLGEDDGDGATVTYDADENTLILNGADLDTAHTESGAAGVIYASGTGTLTIKVEGDSTITASGGNTRGIYLNARTTSENPDSQYELVLTGSALLDIDVENNDAISAPTGVTIQGAFIDADVDSYGEGISTGGKVVIKGESFVDIYTDKNTAIFSTGGVEITGGTVNLNAPNNYANSICTDEGDVQISGNAQVTATSYYGLTSGWYDWNNGIAYGGDVIISGNAVVKSTSFYDCGIYTPNQVYISDNAYVEATGYYAALRGDTGIQISGGTVIATSKGDCGMYTAGDFGITGGQITAIGETNSAIYVNGADLEISGDAEVTCISGGDDHYGLVVEGGLTVSDTAVLTSTDAVAGLYVSDALNITGGTVDIASVYATCDINISGGAHVTAAGYEGNAIYVHRHSIHITGNGTVVEATGAGEDTAGIFASGDGRVFIDDGAVVRASGPYRAIASNFKSSGDHYPIHVVGAWVEANTISSQMALGNSVLFVDGVGTVYGHAIVPEGVEIPAGSTLTIPEGDDLTIPQGMTFTNNGEIINNGTIHNSNAIIGSGTITGSGTSTNTVTGVSLNKTATTLYVKNSQVLTATITPENATNQAVDWSSSDETIVTVNENGLIVAKAAGEATITVTTQDGGYTATCAVTVIQPSPDDGDSLDPSYSIQLDIGDHGSVHTSHRSAEAEETVTLTVTPDDGYVLESLTVIDSRGNAVELTRKSSGQYTFEMPARTVTATAVFAPEGGAAPEISFADVPEDFWAYDEITWAYENGYVNGNTATTFNPDGTITRQQVWMILARLSGATPTDMAAAKAWAVANGVSDGTNPGAPVTRQQLAAMLYRYAVANGMAAVTLEENLSGFPDAASVSSYAVQALNWAVGRGIITGTTAGTLNSGGPATRAQFAVMLWRYCQTAAV